MLCLFFLHKHKQIPDKPRLVYSTSDSRLAHGDVDIFIKGASGKIGIARVLSALLECDSTNQSSGTEVDVV